MKFIKFAIWPLFFSLVACFDLEEIEFVDFQADAVIPSVVRVDSLVQFEAGALSDGAQSYLWSFGDSQNTQSEEANPSFQYDSIGFYTVRLRVTIQKSDGLQVDSLEKRIAVIPQTLSTGHPSVRSLSQFDPSTDFEAISIAPFVNESGFMLLGRTNINGVYLASIDSAFTIQLEKTINGLAQGQIIGAKIQGVSDGDFVVSGRIQYSSDDQDAFLLKVNPQGDLGANGWFQQVSSLRNESYTDIFEYRPGLLLAIGTVFQNNRPQLLLDIYNLDGQLINSQQWGSNWRAESAELILAENKLLVAGRDFINPAIFSFELLDTNAVFLNEAVLRGVEGTAREVLNTRDGRFVMAGSLGPSGSDSLQAFLAKFNSINASVTPLWFDTLQIYQDDFYFVREFINGDLIVYGNHYNPLSGRDILISFYDENGIFQKARLLGSEGEDKLQFFQPAQDSLSVILGGYSRNTGFSSRKELFVAQVLNTFLE